MSNMFDRYDATVDLYPSAAPSLPSGLVVIKVLLLVINIVFVIFGIVLIAVGSYAMNSSVNALTGQSLPVGIISLGAFTLALAVIGAVSAWKQNRNGLAVYFTALVLIALCMFAVGIAVYIAGQNAPKYITQSWQNAPPAALDALQAADACCGLTTYGVGPIGSGCPQNVTANATCLPLLQSQLSGYYNSAGACGIAFSIVMAAMMTFVCVLFRGIGDVNKKKEQHARVSNTSSRLTAEDVDIDQEDDDDDVDELDDEEDDDEVELDDETSADAESAHLS